MYPGIPPGRMRMMERKTPLAARCGMRYLKHVSKKPYGITGHYEKIGRALFGVFLSG